MKIETNYDESVELAISQPEATQVWLKVAGALQWLALSAFLIAGFIFMLQGINDLDSVGRSWAFTAFLTCLAILAFVCIRNFGDPKGARVSLGVATILAPIGFLQIGGLILSATGAVPVDSMIPSVFLYTAPTLALTLVTSLVVCGLLSAITYLGFQAFARGYAVKLTALLSVANLLILLPVRDEGLLSALFLGIGGFVTFSVFKLLRQANEGSTLYLKSALLLPIVPIMLCAIRQFVLYYPTEFLVGLLMASAGFVIFRLPTIMSLRKPAVASFELLGTLIVVIGSLILERDIAYGILDHLGIRDYQTVISVLMVGTILSALSALASYGAVYYRRVAALLVTFGLLLELGGLDTLWAGMLGLTLGTLIGLISYLMKEKVPLISGSFLAFYGLVIYVDYAVRFMFGMGPWIGMAVFGVMALILSSYLERGSINFGTKVAALKNRLATWS